MYLEDRLVCVATLPAINIVVLGTSQVMYQESPYFPRATSTKCRQKFLDYLLLGKKNKLS